jgi:hypothetical protein
MVAEREGFEPSMEVLKPHTPLAGERLQPLGHLSLCGVQFSRIVYSSDEAFLLSFFSFTTFSSGALAEAGAVVFFSCCMR